MNKLGKFAAACAAVLCGFGASAGSLPAEYQQVEYVQSDGSQVIDTEVVINENHELRFKYAMLQIDAYKGPFGSYVSENNNATRVMSNNGSTTDLLVNFMTKAGGGGTAFPGVTKKAGEDVEGYMNLTKASFNGVEKTLTRTTFGTADTSTMKLLGRSGYSTSIRLYYFRIFESGELVHDYVPCYLRGDSSKVGFYDVVGNKFFSAANLVKGDDVRGDRLIVAGNPEQLGEVTPPYGTHTGLAVGEARECSAPAICTNASETTVATCVGYKVYTNGVVSVEGDGCSFIYEHPDCETGAKLIWQWERQPLRFKLLPAEYQEVAYVQSDGSQVIDTKEVITESHELQFRFAIMKADAYKGPFGSYVGENNNATRVMSNNGSPTDLVVNFMTKASGGTTVFPGVTKAAGDDVEGYMNYDKASFNGVELDLAHTTFGAADTSTMKLLGRSGYSTSIRLYYFRIFEGGELVHDYVPCRLSSNSSKAGFYDLVGNEFLSAANLVIGPDVYRRDVLAVTGAPEQFGETTPAYGTCGGYSVGQRVTCTAPANWESGDGAVKATCVGYKLYVDDILSAHGTDTSFEYTHPDSQKGGRLVWQWRKYRRVTVAVAGGEDAPAVSYVAEGDPIAAPEVDGKIFAYWSGDVADLPVFNATVKQTGDVNRALVANYVDEEPEIVENTYTGAKDGKWNVDGNWSLTHIPTAYETAVVPTGKGTVVIEDSAICAKLVINNDVKVRLDGTANTPNGQPRLDVRGDVVVAANGLQLGNGVASVYQPLLNVGGDLMVSNNNRTAYLDVYAGDPWGTKTKEEIAAGYTGEHPPREAEYQRGGAWVNVAGRLFLGGKNASNTSQIRVWSHRYTGMSAVFTVGSFVTDTHGYVDVASSEGADGCKGWRSTSDGYYGIGVAPKNGGGASYGGLGGHTSESDLSTIGKTYGYALAPFWCGSSQSRGGSDGGHGGGLFRLHAAGAVELNGTITANGASWGSNTSRGGGSGGGVWITCDTFTPGASAKITAKGGNHSVDGGPTGGGGRVAVATGCTATADIAEFLSAGDCVGFVATDFALTDYPALVSVAGGRNTNIDTYNPGTKPWLVGTDGTAFLVQNSRGSAPLTVTATPYRLGAADPTLATHIVSEGSQVCSEDEIVFTEGSDGQTRLHLQGAAWTNAVANGTLTGASVTVPVNGATTLVWLYGDMEHRLVATSGGYGSISAYEEWVDDGKEVTLTATPEAGCAFLRWEGDVTAADKTSASITFTMDAPKRLVAIFANPSAEPRAFTFDGTGDWYDLEKWDGTAIPSAKDTVTVTGNATLPLAAQVDVGNLVVSAGTLSFDLARDVDAKLAVAGDLTVANGAKISLGALKRTGRADLAVGGTLTLNGTGAIEVFAGEGTEEGVPDWRAFKQGGSAVTADELVLNGTSKLLVHAARYSGLSVVCNIAGDVTVAEGARIAGSNYTSDNNCYGWGWEAKKGLGYDSAGKGGAYGGIGGNNNTKTNGWVYAPFYPGSPGSYRSDNRGQGGGAVRIAAGGTVTLNGGIYVTGGHNENAGNHAGSGGGVWITCAEFVPGANAKIHARGGRSNQHGSAFAGGGGRVAIMTGSPSAEQIDALYETGTCDDLLVVAEDMNDAVASPWPNLVNVKGGENNDNASNASYIGHGKPGTAVLLKNSFGQSVVTIGGNVPTTETKPAYGMTSVDRGEQTFTAPKYIYTEDGLSRYECLGWEWEDAKGGSGSGETVSTTVDVQADLTFTWKWSGIQRKLTARSGGYGSVAWDGEEWYDDGTVVSLTAVPAAGCTFVCWAGEFDYSNDANKSAALTLTMDRPREVVALFQGTAPRTLTWNAGGTSDWFDKANWDGEAVPSALDTVVFSGGTFQVKFPFEMKVANWTQGGGTVGFVGTEMETKTADRCNDYGLTYVKPLDAEDERVLSLTVSGDLALAGDAKLWFGGLGAAVRHDVTVGGDFTMGGKSAFELYAGFEGEMTEISTFVRGGGTLKVGGNLTLTDTARLSPVAHPYSGAPIVMTVAQTATIGEKASINANTRGYGRRFWNPGTGWKEQVYGPGADPAGSTDRWGGTYGGLGGRASAAWFPDGVGYLLAPFYPGSAGRCTADYTSAVASGGGAVRLSAHRIVLEGTIAANGDGQYQTAGGSGGGVWLTSRKFKLGPKGMISAKGGRCNNYGATGGGGGGRISVMVRANADQIAKLYATGALTGGEVANLADLSDWEGHFDVTGGLGGDNTDPGKPGTAVFVTAPVGLMLIVK